MRTDTLFFRLFQERPALLFELAGWGAPDGAEYRWRAEEVKETAFRLDGVLLPEGDGTQPPVFVEVQSQLSREEIKMVLELQDVDLKRSRFYQEVFAEGREEGREEGIDEGRRREAHALVLRMLRRRFGELSPVLEARLAEFPLERLERLAEDLLGFQVAADLDRWLG